MRYQLQKLTRSHSTKAERKFSELCKKHHIPFRYKVKIQGYEIDFLIGHWAIEIAGHVQNVKKNQVLLAHGYSPFYIYNQGINNDLGQWLKKL